MRKILLIALALTTSVQANTLKHVRTVPSAFTGEWNTNLSNCKSQGGDGILSISSKQISFYESSGQVQDILLKGPHDIIITALLSGEGDTWTQSIHLKLSENDNNTLVDITDGTSSLTR